MKNITQLRNLIVPSLFVVLYSCQQSIDTKAETGRLLQMSRELSAFTSNRGLEKAVSYWADDALMISAGQADVKGKQAIREMLKESYKDPSFRVSWIPQTAEISKSGDLGYVIEDMSVSNGKVRPVTRRFKSVSIWKKQADGSWKNAVNVISPVVP